MWKEVLLFGVEGEGKQAEEGVECGSAGSSADPTGEATGPRDSVV